MRRGSSGLTQKVNNLLYFFGGVLTVCLIAVIVIGMQVKTKATDNNQTNPDSAKAVSNNTAEVSTTGGQETGGLADYDEKWQEGTIEHKGKRYLYDSSLNTYLIMGIDNDNPVEDAKDGVSGGQSDAMFLLVTDSENKTMKVISINRNTMTKVAVYDASGKSLGDSESQICVQHGFGDGRRLSCTRTVEAVQYLFYNIPIKGYAAINMGAIPALNNSVGGVEVEVLDDLNYPNQGVSLSKGTLVTLNGKEAYCYLRGRDINDFDSATDRLRREEQYINNFFFKLKSISGGNATKAYDVYAAVSDYLVSSIDFESLIESSMEYEYRQEDMYTVPGQTRMGQNYEEYYVDEDAFQDMIFEIFYKEVTE